MRCGGLKVFKKKHEDKMVVGNLQTYGVHSGDQECCTLLVFASSSQQAKSILRADHLDMLECEREDLESYLIKDDDWLKDNAANKEKLRDAVAHVIINPPTCDDCNLWCSQLYDGLCISCIENNEDMQ